MEKLRQYLYWCIDNTRPLTLDFIILNYKNKGFIPSGYSKSNLPTFEQWIRSNPLITNTKK